MRVLAINPRDVDEPEANWLEQALALLRDAGAVALPTETFYGLAVDCFSVDALRRVNRIKDKPADSPILLLMADEAQARQVAADLPDSFHVLARRFWPGPLTLIVPAHADLPAEVSGGRDSVGLRVSGHALPRRLAGALGRPISGVSANRTGQPPCRTAAEVAAIFLEEIGLVLDGGDSTGEAPSTIVDLTGVRPRVLREGLLPLSALEPFL